MSFNRRSFLHKAGLLSGAAFFSTLVQPAWGRRLQTALDKAAGLSSGTLAEDEDFWYAVQQAFTSAPGLINLNNGGVSPAPRTVQEAMKRYYDLSNEAPSYYMWRILDQGRETLRTNLASIAGCNAEEIAINRNASEGMETVIFGLSLQRGDEVVLSKQDYPNIINAWRQRELRDGIRLQWVDLILPSTDEAAIVKAFAEKFTSKTKAVNITHVINWNGQILPVRKIADEAKRRGIEVLVDGAHSFAHFSFRIDELNADYFATSLHKWLYAPIGSGMLYVRKEKIAPLYPLFAAPQSREDNIRKFEHLGTRPFFIEQAVGKAVEFHEMLGMERKAARLHYLKTYWTSRVKDLPRVKIHTPEPSQWSGAIALVSVEGAAPAALDAHLFNQHKIHTTTIQWEGLNGVRVTPNVYTTTKQLDKLVDGISSFVKKT